MAAARLLARGHLALAAAVQAEAAAEAQQVADAAAQWGLTLADAAPEPEPAGRPAGPAAPEATFYLWPENAQAFELWCSVQTQWRHDGEGRSGLDYAAVQTELHLGPWGGARQHRRLYGAVKTMERAALAVWATQRAEARAIANVSR